MDLAKDTFGEAQDTAENQADTDAEWSKMTNDMINDINKSLEGTPPEALSYLLFDFRDSFLKFTDESQTGKCLQLMGAYAELLAYCDMMAETEG